MSAADQSVGTRWVRWSAVIIILGVGAAAFRLSFATLKDLAVLASVQERDAWLFPLIVDGTIVLATFGVLVLANTPERRFFVWVLAVGAVVSVAGNSLHAVTDGHDLPGWAAALVAAIAPISLLADTHGLVLLFRAAQRTPVQKPEQVADPVMEPVSEPVPVKVPSKPVARRRAVSPRRDPAKIARAVAMRAENKSYAEIGKALGVSARTAANYAPSIPEAKAPEPAPVVPARMPAPVQPIRPVRPVQQLLPIAVPVGGN